MSGDNNKTAKVNADTLASFQNSIMEWLGVEPVGEEEKGSNDLVPARSLSRRSGRSGSRLSTPRTLSSANKSGLGKGDK